MSPLPRCSSIRCSRRIFSVAQACSLLLLAPLLIGCDQKSVDKFVDQAKQTAEDAGSKIKEAAEETSKSVKKAAKETGAQLKDAAEKTKTQITKAAAQARESIRPTGSMKLDVQGMKSFDACYATLSNLPGRGSVLTLRTAKTPSEETFPSVLVVVTIDAEVSAAALSGKGGEASVFAAIKDEADVWKTTAPVKVKILSVEGVNIRGQFTGGELRHVPTGAIVIPTGEFVGVLPAK